MKTQVGIGASLFYFSMGICLLSCGDGNSSGVSTNKTPATADGFVVDMALEAAPAGKCPSGGVVQRYYSDVNANGTLDSGEDLGHTPLYDCYVGIDPSSNPCEKNNSCNSPNLGLADSKTCQNSSALALDTVFFIASMNSWDKGLENLDPIQKCLKTNEKAQSEKNLDVIFSSRVFDFPKVDYSSLTTFSSLNEIIIDGASNAYIPSENMTAMRSIVRPKSLVIQSFDFSEKEITSILPQKGTDRLLLEGIHVTDLRNFASWIKSSNTLIESIVASSIMTTTGPRP